MMLILKDSTDYPKLFDWNGPIDIEQLKYWINRLQFEIPFELIDLWAQTGGGNFFETETILAPIFDVTLNDTLLSINEFQWKKGMPRKYLIFHIGMGGFTAVNQGDGGIVVLDPEDFHVIHTFIKISKWYEHCIRAEYADRYNMKESTLKTTNS